MAPPPIKITINTKVYNIPLLNGEMDDVYQDMENNKEEIERSRQRYANAKTEYDNNCNQLLLLYIQQTGEFPPS